MVNVSIGYCIIQLYGKKKISKKKPTWAEERKKEEEVELEFVTLVSPWTGRDEKGAPIRVASIHIGALVGAGSLWPAGITPGVTYLIGDVLAKLTGPVPCSRLSTTRRPPGGVLIPGPRNGTVVGTSPGAFWRFAPPSHTRGNHGLPCQ